MISNSKVLNTFPRIFTPIKGRKEKHSEKRIHKLIKCIDSVGVGTTLP
jgi:hypothetical protein